MRELVLVFDDLYLHSGAAAQARDALRLRYAGARPLVGGWRSVFARRLGRGDLALAQPAEVVAAAAGLAADEWWLATPMHWQAGLASVHVPADAILSLSEHDSDELVTAFAQVFGGDGLELRRVAAMQWLLGGLETPGAQAAEPARMLGATLDDAAIAGAGAATLRRLGSEIQMWLHDLPLNRRREQAGLPRISALWLWGGGVTRRDGIARSESPFDAGAALEFCSADPWVRAVCALAGASCSVPEAELSRTLARAMTTGPMQLWVLASWERTAYEQAVAALQGGTIDRLTVLGNDRATTLVARDRWRFWRPRRDLSEALS